MLRSAPERPSNTATMAASISPRLTVERTKPIAGHEIDVVAKLGRYHNILAQWLQCLANESLVLEGAIGFRGVEEGHAALHGGADELNHGRTVRRLSVATAHSHAPETYFRDFEALVAKLPLLHCCDSFLVCCRGGLADGSLRAEMSQQLHPFRRSTAVLLDVNLFHPVDILAFDRL